MIDTLEIKVGDKVCYIPQHYRESGRWENGIVKEIPRHTNREMQVVKPFKMVNMSLIGSTVRNVYNIVFKIY